MQFSVRILNGQRIDTLRVDASDLAAARNEAERLKLQVVSIAGDQSAAGRRRPTFAVTLFAQEVSALLDAGLGVVEALEGLLDKEASAHGRAVVSALLDRLREGQRLSAALRAQGDVFPPLFTGLVQAAEQTSDLPRALTRYVEYAQRLEQVRSRVVSALIYPVLLLMVGGAVCLFLMGYVVPRFAQVYQGSGRPLPWLSQRLLDWGQWVAANGVLAGTVALIAAAGVAALAVHLWRSGALLVHAAGLPWIGPQLRLLELSRLYLTLGTLLDGGLSIRASLDMAASASSAPVRHALVHVQNAVMEGGSLSAALESQTLTTAIAARLLRVGERSGQLGPMLTRAAQFHELQVSRTIERFSRLFEPLLMTAIGLAIGVIVVLLYLPVFDLVGSFG